MDGPVFHFKYPNVASLPQVHPEASLDDPSHALLKANLLGDSRAMVLSLTNAATL